MMHIRTDYPLEKHHTFGLKVKARQFMEVSTVQEVQALNHLDLSEVLILGEGSNILFTKDFGGLVVKNNIRGKEVLLESNQEVILRIGGGENWNELVEWTVKNEWGGLENLIAIPGSVGAAPVQNIGAYGVSIADVTVQVEGIYMDSGEQQIFEAEKCGFCYRSSIFKTSLKGKFFITHLVIRLIPAKAHLVKVAYPALHKYLQSNVLPTSIESIAESVRAIRESKLPNPKKVGNAGSFFKNPVITAEKLVTLKSEFAEIPSYEEGLGRYKIPAAWLIEKAGWKGRKIGNVGTHQNQPLVLIALSPQAKGREVEELSKQIQRTVKDRFDVDLEPEVNIL